MIITENGRKLLLELIAQCDGAEALLFDTEEIDGGLSLSLHVVDIQEGDRVVEYDNLKVIISEDLDEMLGEVILDELDGEIVMTEVDGCDCGEECDCGDDCGCVN